MTDPQPLPPAHGPSVGLSVLMILIGVILLLPGVCAAFFAIGSAANPPGLFRDSQIVSLWFVCFAIAAGGIVLIWRAVRRLRA
jgi:hypothetical protein